MLILVTNASLPNVGPPCVACKGLAVGKSLEAVFPVTYALPAASTVIAWPMSLLPPPR